MSIFQDLLIKDHMSDKSKETIADIVRMIRKSQNGNVHTISP